jgi:hypothetical protein
MGIHTKVVNVYGVKYDLDAYNDRVRTESENELIKLGQALGKTIVIILYIMMIKI